MASTSKQNQATSLGKGDNSSSSRSPKSPQKNPKLKQSKGSMGLGLILIAISTSLVGLGGLGYFIYQELLSSSKREMEILATAKSSQIESKVATVQRAVDAVAVRAAAFPKQRNAAMYQRLLVESLQNSEPSAAMGIFANGNLLVPNSKSFATYILKEKSGLSSEPNGQKLPAPNDTLLSATPPDIQKLPWYKSVLEGKSVWTAPYNFLGQNIVTYSAAISENNKAVGVVSSDIVVRSLIPEVGAGEDKIGFVVVGAGGKLIASSDSFQAAQAQNPTIAEALNSLTQQSTSQPTGITQTAGNLWAYRQIEGSDWLVATYVPETEIISKLAIPLGAAAISISSILVIAILSFTNSLKKRLQPITEECERFLVQQGNSSIATGKDDIENLSISLKTTLQQVKSNEIRLRNELTQVSATDASSVQTQQQMQQSFAENELIEAEVGDLLDVVSSMEEGDLTIEAQVNDRATGLVADTLNRLREKLVEIISSVLGTAQQVARGASDLEELARTVVLNTAEQAQSVSQGQALTEQVAIIAQRSASQVGVANRSLQEVRETVASGQTAIDTLTESISVLQSGSAQIVQRIKTLGEFVGLAEQFVQDQGQIASLTQVLALNATLVAARAAEQKDPKQFASVAREFESIAGQVNELATQTNDGLTVLQQRTSQIQTVVTAIDSEVQSLSGLVSGFTTGVESSQAAFQNIQVVTEGVVQIGQTITESSTEIAEAAGSTATYISEIAQLAERTAVLTRSARQQAEEMGNQAQQLLQGIQFFRLPENNSAFASATAALPMTDMNLAMDEQISQSEAIAPSVDYSDNEVSESIEDGIDLNLGLIAVPALAVATATTMNAFQQSDEIPEVGFSEMAEEIVTDDEIDDSDLDDYLLEPDYEDIEDSSAASLDRSIDYALNSRADLVTQDDQLLSFMDDLESLDEIDEESEQLYVFDDQAEMQEIAIEEISQTQDDTYSGITDITMIEESLFADLKQEIYQGNSDENTDEYLDQLDELNVTQEDNISLKNQLDGVDETAISEAAVDPMILSATNSFLEETAFGTPSVLSDETLANLPTYVDFNIPDLDSDSDFEIPRNLIESTLDDSNSFFDASFAASSDQVEQVDIESTFDDQSESDSLETDRYVIDEEMFTPSSADADLDISISEQLVSRESEDYNDYVKDEALNESLYDAFSDVSNEVFNDSFGASFDESPFDRAFDEAINDYQTDPFGVMSENLPEDAMPELSGELVEENPDDFVFDQAFDQYSEEEEVTALDSTFDIPLQQSAQIDDGLMGAFSEDIAEVSLVEATEPELSTLDDDNSSTAFPSLFEEDISDENFESAFDMSFDQDLSEGVAEVDQDLDSIWSSETDNLELLDSEQERSPVDDFAMPDFSITEDESVLADLPDAFEAIATEDILTDEMFSFDLSEEPDAPADESVFEMDLRTEDQDELVPNEPPNLFDEELSDSLNFSADMPDILESAQDDTFVEQNSEQIAGAEMDLVEFEQIAEFQAADLSGIDSYLLTDDLMDNFEESATFGIASEDLDSESESLSENPENIADDLNSFYGINPLEESASEEDMSSEADLALSELSDNWLDESVSEGEADAIFEDLLIDYPSLDQPSLETSQDYNIGFADELLDSLMNEADPSNNFLMDMPDNLPDLSDEPVGTVYADPFASPVETDSEESEFDFDFSAFENLDSNDSQDKPSKAIVDARSEIDSFLSETFLELEVETSDKKKLGSEE